MAVAARRVQQADRRQPHLSLVEPLPRPSRRATRTRASAADAARWRSAFRTYVVLLAALLVIASGRVWLTSSAAEATLDSVRLQEHIEAERLEGDKLEVSRSSLTTPSRIRDIAGSSMKMVEPGKVEYLDLPAEETPAATAEGKSGGGMREIIAKAMDLAAGEAQLLLVGDVGLASSR